jgi:predicted DNA-binding protein
LLHKVKQYKANNKIIMAKSLKNFRLSEEAIKQLELLAKEQERSEAYIVDKLIIATIKEKPKKEKKS